MKAAKIAEIKAEIAKLTIELAMYDNGAYDAQLREEVENADDL